MKRFTETTKWDDPWFMDLPLKFKAFWQYILDKCDSAGIWEPNLRLASMQIGDSFEGEETLRVFAGRIERLEGGKWWVSKFVAYQYGELSDACKPHKSVIDRLNAVGILDRVSKGYPKGIHTLQEKEKEKDKEKDEGGNGGNMPVPPNTSTSKTEPPLHEVEATAPATIEQAKASAFTAGVTDKEAEAWWHARNGSDWTRSDGQGGRIKIGKGWRSDMKNYTEQVRSGAIERQQKNGKRPLEYDPEPATHFSKLTPQEKAECAAFFKAEWGAKFTTLDQVHDAEIGNWKRIYRHEAAKAAKQAA